MSLSCSASASTIVLVRTEMNLRAMRLKRFVAAVLVTSACSVAWADLSRDEAAVVAQRLTGGRVLAVERAEAAGRPAWRAKVLTTAGEVRIFLIDAASGRPL